MGEFKPMVKMDTTEPSVELKLKKGGTVAHKPMKGKSDSQKPVKKAFGGGLGAMANMPTDTSDAVAPARPALSLRRKAMAARPSRTARAVPVRQAPVVAAPVMKKGGKTKKMATGGVVKGNGGGYKTGGVIDGQGGYATGGVVLGQGGFKKGGATKKFADGGSAVKMPQGNKKPSAPVAINMLSGSFKKGGNVSAKALRADFKKENAPVVKAAKADTNEKYSPYQKKTGGKVKKYADGGDAMQRANTRGYNATLANETAENEADSKAVRDAIMYVPNKIKGLYDKAKESLKGQGAVTDTERTISRTVTPPAKKRGGRC